jgi:hypothetical protein
MLPSFCSQSITIIRPGTKEVRGSIVPDWEHTAQPVVVGGCSVQPASSSLSLDGRVLGISDAWTAYLPEGTDVKAGDHILFDGNTYEISGEPRVWTGAFTRSHIQLNLTRWEG